MSPLARMRVVVLATVVSLILVVGVGLFLEEEPREGTTWLTPLAFAIGAVSLIIVGWLRRRPLRADDEPGLARAFVSHVLIGMAVAEVPGLLGFAGRLVGGDVWPLVIGASITLIALRQVYPTDAEVDRREAELHAAGSPLSLRRAVGAAP